MDKFINCFASTSLTELSSPIHITIAFLDFSRLLSLLLSIIFIFSITLNSNSVHNNPMSNVSVLFSRGFSVLMNDRCTGTDMHAHLLQPPSR